MKRILKPLTAIAFALSAAAVTAPSFAAEPGANTPNPKFRALDKNGDGFITRDEVVGTRWYDKAFGQADENRDGKLDQAEFVKAEAIQDRTSAGNYVSDTALKTKVKTELLRTRGLASRDLDIEVLGGEVMLSGFVRSEEQKALALRVTNSINGVASVKDGMVVR